MLDDIKANLRANIQGGEAGPPKEIKIEFMSKEEKLRQEKMMAKFKQQILQPYISDNLYMELNVTNLIYMYEKSKKEEKDTKAFFNIRCKTDQR